MTQDLRQIAAARSVLDPRRLRPVSIPVVPPPIRDAIVPVAGLGTRLLPATRSAPKEMLPIVDKPVVQYVVEELARAGIDRVLMVTGRRKRAIEDHFDADPELAGSPPPAAGVQLFYTRQPTPAGLGDAVARGAELRGPVEPRRGRGARRRDPRASRRRRARDRRPTDRRARRPPRGRDDRRHRGPRPRRGRYGIVIGAPLTAGRRRRARRHRGSSRSPRRARSTAGSRSRRATCSGRRCSRRCATRRPDSGGEIQLTDAIASVIEAAGACSRCRSPAASAATTSGPSRATAGAFLAHALTHPQFGEALRAQASALLDDH